MQVYIVPNLTKDIDAAVALCAARTLAKLGATILFSEEMEQYVTKEWQCEYPKTKVCSIECCYAQADVIVTVGGDGTILHEVGESLSYQKPILGVNLGRCGFLATCEEDEMQEKFTKLLQGQYTIDTRILLKATIYSEKDSMEKQQNEMVVAENNETAWSGVALNDVVISKGHTQQAIDLIVYCDNILVESYRCDGVIIATPTGSTAYSLAAGGPIVDSQTMGIVLTAICPHKLRSPSMVFAPNRVLRIVVDPASRGEVLLSCDGQSGLALKGNESVEITLSDQRVQLVSFSDAEQFEAIDRKLKSKV